MYVEALLCRKVVYWTNLEWEPLALIQHTLARVVLLFS
jgi:hypothetical protein